MEPQQHESRLAHRPDETGDEAEPGALEIDLDRAMWDAEYRSRALALLRRARGAGDPSSGAAPQPPKADRKQR